MRGVSRHWSYEACFAQALTMASGKMKTLVHDVDDEAADSE